MNIHEHQAKQILKKYGVKVPNGIFGFTVDEVITKAKSLKTNKYVLKAQIHSGGRGKAGGVKILNNIDELNTMMDGLINSGDLFPLSLKKAPKDVQLQAVNFTDKIKSLRKIIAW